MPNFIALPHHVQHQVFLLIHDESPQALLPLRTVSHKWCNLVDKIIYRSISLSRTPLSGHEEYRGKYTERMVQRILDPNDNLAGSVREVTIRDWEILENNDTDEDMCLDTAKLVKVLQSFENLLALNWNSRAPIPPHVLFTFQWRWPDARFSVTNHARSKPYIPIDTELLRAPLEEIKILESYQLDLEHCMIWRDSMDWSHLRSLDVGDRGPENLFVALTYHVPNLKCLRFRLAEGADPETCFSNMSVVRKFLASIEALSELFVNNSCPTIFEAVWPRVKKHCPSLEVLHVHSPVWFTNWPKWGVLELDDLLSRSPGLTDLSIDMGLWNEDAAIGDENRLLWVAGNVTILTKLACLNNLRSLTIFIKIPPDIKPANAHIGLRDAQELFQKMMTINVRSKLECLEIRTLKHQRGFFDTQYEDVITAKVTRDMGQSAADLTTGSLVGSVEEGVPEREQQPSHISHAPGCLYR